MAAYREPLMCIGHASLLRHIVFHTCTHVIIIFYLVTIYIYTPGSCGTSTSLLKIQNNPTYASFIINPPLMIPGSVSVSLLIVVRNGATHGALF